MPDALLVDETAGRPWGPGADPAALGGVRDAVGAVATSTEAGFVAIGERLETAIDVVGRLAGTFDALRAELEGDTLSAASRDLAQAADRVSAIVGAQRDERTTLVRLGDLTVAIGRRIPAIGKAVKAVEVLAINAKIAAAGIGAAGVEFQGFLSGLVRPLELARSSLERFGAELGEVARRVGAARADQARFVERQSEAAGAIPRRLAASIEAMTQRSARVATAAGAIGSTSQQVRDRIAAAISALQIGDATRQRLEHVVEALGMVAEGGGIEGAAAAPLVLRLQAAQLADAGDELERELERITGAFAELATDARQIATLGQQAYAASDRRHGSFLTELQEQVDAAHALLQSFGEARRDAARVLAAVSDAVGRLAGHIGFIDSLEADLRIMGLNTTLKCSRLGAIGRPLSVIAQELRVYAGETATEASAVMADLESARGAVAALTSADGAGDAEDVTALTGMMARALACFEAAGRSLESALATLDHDSAAVAERLGETAAHLAERRGASRALHQAAHDIEALAARCATHPGSAGAARGALLTAIERRYTMERERAIHELVVHGRALPTTPAAPPAAAADIDDMLF